MVIVNPDVLGEVLSSRARVRIEDAVSVRPRTLGELAEITGISVQGVLRHLKILVKLGLVEERRVASKAPKARRVYAAKGVSLGDYSVGGLTVVKATERVPSERRGRRQPRDLERVSGELLIQRRRIRDEAKRLGRMIDDLVDSQQALAAALGNLNLNDEQKLILEVLLTEETAADGLRVLSRYYGLGDRRSIDKAQSEAKRNVG
jgi:DNA-binding transcriptional ArsR family regulator